MFVCMPVCVYACMHVCMYVCMYYIYTNMFIYHEIDKYIEFMISGRFDFLDETGTCNLLWCWCSFWAQFR